MDSRSERRPASPDSGRNGMVVLVLVVAVIFGTGLFFAGAHGFSGLYLWSVMFAVGTGLALVMFWARRREHWYWPTAALLISAHVILLSALKWQLFSGTSTQFGSGSMLKGAIGADFAANALALYIVYGFFDPGSRAKSRPLAVAKAIKLGFALLALAAPLAILLLVQAHRQSG